MKKNYLLNSKDFTVTVLFMSGVKFMPRSHVPSASRFFVPFKMGSVQYYDAVCT